MNQCFAHDGVAKFGMLDQYQCGIFESASSAGSTAGPGIQAIPEVDTCLMHKTGSCVRDIKVTF
jgi:hypothetical protein